MIDEEVDELCNDACKLYREVDAFDELAGVEIALAVAYPTRGGHDRAIELLIDAEQLLAGTDTEPHLRAMRHFAAARRAFIADEHDAAERAFRRSIELLEQTGADVHRAFAFRYVGRLAAIRGEFSESVTAIEHALKLASELSLTGFANVLMSDLGESLGLSGDFAASPRGARTALDDGARRGIPAGDRPVARCPCNARTARGDCERAARLAKEALDIAVAADDDETLADCLATLGLVAALQGDLVEARAWHMRGLELATRSDQPRRTALALEGRANVALLEHENRLAVRLLGAASALRRSPGRAAGSAYAVGARIDAERLLAVASEALGPEIASRTFQDGAADPQSTVAALIATD